MRFASFEQTVPYFSLSEEAINILHVITNGDYADDINYHYFQLLHPARPCRLWGQLPVEEPPPATVRSLAEPSDCVTLSFSVSVFLPLFLPPLAAFVSSSLSSSILSLPLALCQWTQEALRTIKGEWMNEVRWKLIVGRSEIHGTDCSFLNFPFFFLFVPCPPPPLLFYSSPSPTSFLCFGSRPSLNLVALSLPFPTLPHFWHETSISAPWNMEMALMNCLLVSSMHANGGRGTDAGFQAGCGGWMVVMTGRIGPTEYVRKPVGPDYHGLQPIMREFGEFSAVTNKLSRRMYVYYT